MAFAFSFLKGGSIPKVIDGQTQDCLEDKLLEITKFQKKIMNCFEKPRQTSVFISESLGLKQSKGNQVLTCYFVIYTVLG